MKKILVSGASGLIGKKLCNVLHSKGYQVETLVRSRKAKSEFKSYLWDYDHAFIEDGALENTTVFIHLAGATISKRWTKSYKKEIYDSRIHSSQFIFDEMTRRNVFPHAVISSSATGFYGQLTSEKIFFEDDPAGHDFLGMVCRDWEEKAVQFEKLGSRVVRIRTSTVLSRSGGALAVLRKPVDYHVGAVLGDGQQYFPWIHIDDLVAIYVKAVEDASMNGAYNAAAPDFVNNKILTQKIANHLGQKIWLPNIPKLIIRTMLGEMSCIALEGSRVSSDKIQKAGFRFQFADLDTALSDVL